MHHILDTPLLKLLPVCPARVGGQRKDSVVRVVAASAVQSTVQQPCCEESGSATRLFWCPLESTDTERMVRTRDCPVLLEVYKWKARVVRLLLMSALALNPFRSVPQRA